MAQDNTERGVKRKGFLWDEMISLENLYAASRRARKGKRYRRSCAAFEYQLESELVALHHELRNKTYTPSPYRTFKIYEPKEREIAAAAYRDRVVHHALTDTLNTIFEPTFIANSFACRKGKGTHAAMRRCKEYAARYPYVWKCDIQQFFPSVDHRVLLSQIARKIKDPNVMWLCDQILCHSPATHFRRVLFPGDDLFTGIERPCGLPIGNQTSQFFANVYMNPLDHFIAETCRRSAYVRYVDDFLVFADRSGDLVELRKRVADFCEGLRLKLHPRKNTIQRCQDGIRFLGFRVFPTHVLLAHENVDRFVRRVRQLSKQYASGLVNWKEVQTRLVAWHGHAQQVNTFRLRSLLYGTMVFRKGSR